MVCGSLWWFVMVCGGLSYSHTHDEEHPLTVMSRGR